MFIKFRIATASPQFFQVDLDKIDTIKTAKAKFEEHAKIPVHSLLFNGHLLSDESTIEELKMNSQQYILVVLDSAKGNEENAKRIEVDASQAVDAEESTSYATTDDKSYIQRIKKEVEQLKKSQESLFRNQKRRGTVIFGWPHDQCPFETLHRADAKIETVKTFFQVVLKMNEKEATEVDIQDVFASEKLVIINFVRDTDKEKIRPFFRQLETFNRNRPGKTPVICKDDQTRLQMQQKKQKYGHHAGRS